MRGARRPSGFTLIEILATLGVLAIGLAAIVAMVLGSTRATATAADRNVATFILSEAIEDIRRTHLVTQEMVSGFTPGYEDDVGLFIETTQNYVDWDQWPNIHVPPYDATTVRSGPNLSDFINPVTASNDTMIWPPAFKSPRYGGPLASPSFSSNGANGIPYRVIYSLQRHPGWAPDPILPPVQKDSPFVGVYVLTLAVYRDMDPNLGPGDVKKRYEQISDPTAVYLHATHLR